MKKRLKKRQQFNRNYIKNHQLVVVEKLHHQHTRVELDYRNQPAEVDYKV